MNSKVTVPDLGGVNDAEVVELLVEIGDAIKADSPIIVVEGEKSTVEIPSPRDGIVKDIICKVGDRISSGQDILELETNENQSKKTDQNLKQQQFEICLPDIGAGDAKVIEILVKPGDIVNKDDSIITLESEKASMDLPTPFTGEIAQVIVSKGDTVKQGDIIAKINVQDEKLKNIDEQPSFSFSNSSNTVTKRETNKTVKIEEFVHNPNVHASPSVRRIAREFGVDLGRVTGTGRKGRIIIEDVQDFVKGKIKEADNGIQLSEPQQIDYKKFGKIESIELSKIKQVTGEYVHRSWLNIPHVTHFDEVDMTDIEAYRKEQNVLLSKDGIKLTPLVFIMKALVNSLKNFPTFNSSLNIDKKSIIIKKYYNIGIAVDTDKGLVVPVIRDVDKKNIKELSTELLNISNKAREKGLTKEEMSGNSFTISSLGGIGGTGFTPIVNSPDVAIMGVSKAKIQPIYISDNFQPRLILPFSLSYDHRVIDGAEAARFCKTFSMELSTIKEKI